MGAMQRVLVTKASFLVILLSGLWLSRSERPLNVAVSTLHKLVALGAAIFLVMTVRGVHQAAPFGAAPWGPVGWVAVVVAGLLFAGLAATGSLLSGDRPMPAGVQKVHQIAPYLTVLSSMATLYLLLSRR